MKLLLAVIQPIKLEPVREALSKLDVTRMTVLDAQGYARQRGRSAVYRGNEYRTSLLRKTLLEIAVNDDYFERTVECITEMARTGPKGHIGDGKIFVLPVEEAIQIGETTRGPGAL